jgi:hypothetical protein
MGIAIDEARGAVMQLDLAIAGAHQQSRSAIAKSRRGAAAGFRSDLERVRSELEALTARQVLRIFQVIPDDLFGE